MATISETFGDDDGSSKPFVTSDPSGISQSERIYALLMDVAVGSIVTYEDFERVLGHDVRPHRQPLYTAIRRAERTGSRTFVSVPNIGYRRVNAHEHVTVGKRHERKAARQLDRAERTYDAADRSALTADERRELDAVTAGVKSVKAALRSHAKRIKRLEDAVETTTNEDALARIVERVLKDRGLLDESAHE
jgi:hypothetical protein